ncbi:hypothetical protein TanjilG_32094 [Lupinus angustifolius]|uniref:Membrane-associated kinase regulator 2 n=1 Tax=Lupinus angustifolius TaxID=3871 RepID=A0A4P1RFH2_LUPAN|nr:PREDICTED: probable membrane-associated kinase regulator 2 [Lupinus angustifolius]OIW09945.1 hypothetical protein TanjilG_32094 [Lupinus angustifolius]
MEGFSFLKYWKPGGTAADLPPPSTTAILTAVTETDDESNTDDEGPFFDLEFTVPDEPPHSPQIPNNTQNDDVQDDNENNEELDSESESECECERELKLTLSPSNQNDPNLSLSPSDDIVVHLELNSSEPNSKPHFTAASSLLKSATKFRVFMSGLKKTKSNIVPSSSHNNNKDKDLNVVSQCRDSVTKNKLQQQQKKLFTVKFKVEEVPIMSLFTRDNSSRVQNKKHNNTTEEELQTQTQTQTHSSSSVASSDEKRLHKYLKMVKPLYVKVSKRYAEKVRFSGQLNMAVPPSATAAQKTVPAGAVVAEKVEKEEDCCEGSGNVKGQKQRNLDLGAGLRVVCKHLGKSRSAAETTAATAPVTAAGVVSSRRRDDSLLQQQDGIQGAILHCKRSFNASRECESSQLAQGVSDPLHEISTELSRKSTNEAKSKK